VKGAEKAGIDASRLKAEVARDIGDYLASDVNFTSDMAEAFWHADTLGNQLGPFLRWRSDVVTSLVAEIRASVRKDVKLLGVGEKPEDLVPMDPTAFVNALLSVN